jgi:hypothetical protein
MNYNQHRQRHFSLVQFQTDAIQRGKNAGTWAHIVGIARFETRRAVAVFSVAPNSSRRADVKVMSANGPHPRIVHHTAPASV